MKAQDLRIGNFINFKAMDEIIAVETICAKKKLMSLEDPEGYLISTSHFPPLLLSMCEPIPLTEDWLLKFGFESVGRVTNWEKRTMRNNGVYLSQNPETKIHYFHRNAGCDITDIKHVHQLQNLYHSLTGQELEIKQLQK